MGLKELIGNDWKPVANVEGFDILDGTYEIKVSGLRPKQNKESQEFDQYQLEITVVKTISGAKGEGRKFWKNYYKDNSDSIKDLLCDLFTMGVDLPTPDDWKEFEGGFTLAIGAKGTLRAWKWTPEKDRQGNLIPKEARVDKQQFKIVKKAKTGEKVATGLPF